MWPVGTGRVVFNVGQGRSHKKVRLEHKFEGEKFERKQFRNRVNNLILGFGSLPGPINMCADLQLRLLKVMVSHQHPFDRETLLGHVRLNHQMSCVA